MWHLALDTTITPTSAGRPSVILLPPDSTVKIGRLAEVALYEPAGAPDYAKSLTSRLHAEITNGADGPVIFDRSQNGTQVDGVGLAKDASRALTDGAVIIFGTRGATATEKSQQKHSYVAANFKYVVRQGAPALASLDPNVTPTAPAAKPAGPTQQPITPMSSQQEPSSQDDADGRLTPAAAAARLGYTDVNSSFFRDDATGARTAVTYAAHEQLPSELSSKMVPYESLRAFETTDGRGYGVCCTRALQKGDLIVEAVGAA